jgi:hypothetical protein
MTDAALLDHITRLPHAKANFKQLVRELGAKGATRADLDLVCSRAAIWWNPAPAITSPPPAAASTPSAASTCTATAMAS